LRENKWRALRFGLEAEVITNPLSDIKNLRVDILEWIEKLRPYSAKLGYDNYLDTLIGICNNGNSSSRQRKVFEKTGSLREVAEFNVREFENQAPLTP
jgi:carboxylate-amine ligase